MTPQILVLGDVGLDRYPDGRWPGGCALNTALAMARSGLAPALAGPLGEDAPHLRAAAASCGVDVSWLLDTPGPSPCQEIEVLPDGERRFGAYHPGVLAEYRPSAGLWDFARSLGRVYLPVFSHTLEWAEALLRLDAEIDLFFDIMDLGGLDRSFLQRAAARARWLFAGLGPEPSDPRASELIALAQRSSNPRLGLVITHGPAGARAIDGIAAPMAAESRSPAAVCHPLDTTGCGDAFAGAFLAAWLQGQPLSACLDRAAALAGQVALRLGGTWL